MMIHDDEFRRHPALTHLKSADVRPLQNFPDTDSVAWQQADI